MRRHISRALYVAVAALTLGTLGFAGAGSPATAASRSNGGANFGVWLRAVQLTYTSGFAGYTDSIGPFRFISTTMTMPPAQTPAGNGGTALVSLGHNGGATPRPYADITVVPRGGAASISYASNNARGAFTLNPAPGDQVTVSIFYDQTATTSSPPPIPPGEPPRPSRWPRPTQARCR